MGAFRVATRRFSIWAAVLFAAASMLSVTDAAAQAPSSTGCSAANSGAFDFLLPAGELLTSQPFTGDFDAGETLSFELSTPAEVEHGFVEDATAGATILDSRTPVSESYSVPASGPRDFNLELDTNDFPGEIAVTCAPAEGSITIVKNSGGDAGVFDFSGDLGVFQLETSGGVANASFTALGAGVYHVLETASGGFTLDDIACTGDLDGGTTIDLAAGEVAIDLDGNEDIVCTFTNTAVPAGGDITIRVESPDGDGDFSFGGDLNGFSITTNGGTASSSFSELSADLYQVQYIENPDFVLTGVSCSGDTDGGNVIDAGEGAADIDLDDSEEIVCTFELAAAVTGPSPDEIVDASQQTIRNFLYRRANAILSEEPDRPRLIRKKPGVLWEGGLNQFRVAANDEGGLVDLGGSTGPVWGNKFDLWAEGHYTWYNHGAGGEVDGEFGVVYLGADYLLSENLLLGVLGQIDWTSETTAVLGESVEGHGWMVGPYASARLAESLFVDVRAAWGRSTNDLTIDGYVADDSFSTDRFLLRGNVTGNRQIGDWRVTPNLSVAWFEENQKEYLSNTGVLVGGQNVALGRAAFAPEIARKFVTAGGTLIEPQLTLEGVWDFETPDGVTAPGIGPVTDEIRMRVEGALMIAWTNGYALRAAGSFDGIGAEGFEAYGARLWLDIPIGGRR